MKAYFKVLDLHDWIEETSKTYKTNDPVVVCDELKRRLKEIEDINIKKAKREGRW